MKVPDLSLPNGISSERLDDRRAFLNLVDGAFRERADRGEYDHRDR